MSSKKALTDEELFAQFEDIPSESTPTNKTARTSKPAKASADTPAGDDDDPLAELSALAAARPTSRPGTPRLSGSTSSGTTSGTGRQKTPASSGPPSGRTSEERARPVAAGRKSTESSRNYHQGQSASNDEGGVAQVTKSLADTLRPAADTAQAQPAPAAPAAQGGGWWGSMFSAATAAVKQAEAAVKEIQGNEEAQKWAQQVRGNVQTLKAYGANARSLAMPTFTNLLQTIAPPISAHERLQIHITHDLLSYPSLDPLIYNVFSRVMSQVEGGDLLVIQRGSESRARGRRPSEIGYSGSTFGGGPSGWNDGPWWRETSSKRDLGSVPGLVEGSKLARASAEAYAHDFFSAGGGVEEAAKQVAEVLSESNPVRSSDIFLAIQAVSQVQRDDLFAPGPKKTEENPSADEPAEKPEEVTVFAVYLYDPIHSISFSTVSQSFPSKWAEWMDASAENEDDLPESIKEVIESGGVDVREWVAEWMEETLSLAVGTLAQRYVAKRMGVGEGGLGRGKRVMVEEGTAGEAARAI